MHLYNTLTKKVEEFIPTESIMSLLNFAINSNIEVRLMVPLKANRSSRILCLQNSFRWRIIRY